MRGGGRTELGLHFAGCPSGNDLVGLAGTRGDGWEHKALQAHIAGEFEFAEEVGEVAGEELRVALPLRWKRQLQMIDLDGRR